MLSMNMALFVSDLNNSPFAAAAVTGSDVIPDSPTAPLWTSSSSNAMPTVEASRRVNRKKSVRFEEDVKAHDGLTERSSVLDRLITTYFVYQQEISELDIICLTGQNPQRISELHEDLLDIIARITKCMEEGKVSTPVLPGGGGGCTKLCAPHLPYVKILDRVVEAALSRVINVQVANQ